MNILLIALRDWALRHIRQRPVRAAIVLGLVAVVAGLSWGVWLAGLLFLPHDT